MKTIAALFVLEDGPYSNLEGVEVWGVTKNAKKYKGPHKVIAHPPCERWGRYWYGGPSCFPRKKLGDDNGCFKSALSSVRKYGGVLEHPEASHAFKKFKLGKPHRKGGWQKSDDGIGWICCVEQGWYGHRARKATWLYAVNIGIFDLKWGKAPGDFVRLEDGYHSKEERARAVKTGMCQRLSKRQRALTPIKFRNLLLKMVRMD